MTWRVKAPCSSLPTNPGVPPIVAVSSLMTSALEEALRYARQDCPVLVQGETGTGKEVIARIIHGGRGPFVVVDCTHLTPQLAESELFGCVRGAYTSADSERSGLIEAAHSGTAFFDEIGELPLDVQAKLLRLLQEKTYRRVGSTREQHSEFRVIAATHRELKRDVQAGRFRQDLYYRLNVAKIQIPALRDRKEDIPLLVQHFLRSTGLEASPEVLETLLRHQWPGNVRELENCIRRMVAKSYGDRLSPAHIPATVCAEITEQTPQLLKMATALQNPTGRSVNSPQPPEAAVSVPTDPQSLPEVPLLSMQKLEFLAIISALRATGGDRVRAADLLEIGRTTLYRKLLAMSKYPEFHSAVQKVTGVVL